MTQPDPPKLYIFFGSESDTSRDFKFTVFDPQQSTKTDTAESKLRVTDTITIRPDIMLDVWSLLRIPAAVIIQLPANAGTLNCFLYRWIQPIRPMANCGQTNCTLACAEAMNK